MSQTFSEYFKNLQSHNTEAAERYKHKIKIINGVDPFTLDCKNLSFDPTEFPPITNMDIVAYLVLSTSFYTSQQMKAYKSLNAFKYFDAGFVEICGARKINEIIIIIGKVKHSQRLSLPPVNLWIMCKDDGSVETAHCTCMAGLGEVCSHIGAVLYGLEYIHTSRGNTSCTDVRAIWKIPKVKKVEYTTVKSMNLRKIVKSSTEKDIPALTSDEITNLLKNIQDAGSASVLMTVVEPFASEIADSSQSLNLANPYENLYRKEYESLSLEELKKIALNVDVKISQEECNEIKQATIGQANSPYWYRQRIGRLTASILKNICKTSLLKPSLSLIKTICYPLHFDFLSKATHWGKVHEKDALKAYKNEQNSCHEDLVVTEIGLCIDPTYPYLGATPDSLVTCSCCGSGCVEVKCPYLLRECSIVDYSKLKGSCLLTSEEGTSLKTDHSYYYQIQQQMAITGTRYCDFVVWSPNELFIERIFFNEDFWYSQLLKCREFYKNVILPELLGKFFTKNNANVDLFCICKLGDDKRPILLCDNANCSIKWYHMGCVGLMEVPIDLWFCVAWFINTFFNIG